MSGVFGYENACGDRERLECPYSTCDGCPLNPRRHEADDMETDEEEALLLETEHDSHGRPTYLMCSNCRVARDYHSWYSDPGFVGRKLMRCPSCGMRILGVVRTNG